MFLTTVLRQKFLNSFKVCTFSFYSPICDNFFLKKTLVLFIQGESASDMSELRECTALSATYHRSIWIRKLKLPVMNFTVGRGAFDI